MFIGLASGAVLTTLTNGTNKLVCLYLASLSHLMQCHNATTISAKTHCIMTFSITTICITNLYY
jgi:hypothetical protein